MTARATRRRWWGRLVVALAFVPTLWLVGLPGVRAAGETVTLRITFMDATYAEVGYGPETCGFGLPATHIALCTITSAVPAGAVFVRFDLRCAVGCSPVVITDAGYAPADWPGVYEWRFDGTLANTGGYGPGADSTQDLSDYQWIDQCYARSGTPTECNVTGVSSVQLDIDYMSFALAGGAPPTDPPTDPPTAPPPASLVISEFSGTAGAAVGGLLFVGTVLTGLMAAALVVAGLRR